MQSYLWADVLLGNVMTLSILWAMTQFHKHDYKAPWLAYAAFLLPVAFFVLSLIATGQVPAQFAAQALR